MASTCHKDGGDVFFDSRLYHENIFKSNLPLMAHIYVTHGSYCGDAQDSTCVGFADNNCGPRDLSVSERLMWMTEPGEHYDIFITGYWGDAGGRFRLAVAGISSPFTVQPCNRNNFLTLECRYEFCNGNGNCTASVNGGTLEYAGCNCDKGWSGSNCSTYTCIYTPPPRHSTTEIYVKV